MLCVLRFSLDFNRIHPHCSLAGRFLSIPPTFTALFVVGCQSVQSESHRRRLLRRRWKSRCVRDDAGWLCKKKRTRDREISLTFLNLAFKFHNRKTNTPFFLTASTRTWHVKKEALGNQEVDLFNTRKMQISPQEIIFFSKPLAWFTQLRSFYYFFLQLDAAARAQFILWWIRDRDLVS